MPLPAVEKVSHPSLEIEEDIKNFRRGVVVQNWGRIMMFLLLILAIAGLFGSGPASEDIWKYRDIEISYERFVRCESEMKLEIHGNAPGDSLSVFLPHSYLQNLRIERIQPEPANSILTAAGIRYSFTAKDRAEVVFSFLPEAAGIASGRLLVNGTRADISHFIYP